MVKLKDDGCISGDGVHGDYSGGNCSDGGNRGGGDDLFCWWLMLRLHFSSSLYGFVKRSNAIKQRHDLIGIFVYSATYHGSIPHAVSVGSC